MLVADEKIDPRVKRTRQLLQTALSELLHEKSFHSVTVQDIAARAEVNRATFYAHFEDKYALLNYSMRETFQARLLAQLPENPALTLENLRVLILTVCEFLGDFTGHCAPVMQFNEQAQMVMQVQMSLNETMLAWVRNSPLANATLDVAPATVAVAVSWAIWGLVFQWARDGRKIPAAQLADQVLALLRSGLQGYLRDEAAA